MALHQKPVASISIPSKTESNQDLVEEDAPSKVLSRFGEPLKKELAKEPDQSGVDTIIQTWSYKGLTITMRGPSEQAGSIEQVTKQQ